MKMKNWLAGLLVLAMLATMAMPALAADMGVQIIGGPEEEETEPVSMDDIKIDAKIEIPGYGNLTPTSFEYLDKMTVYYAGDPYYGETFSSGAEAEYALLKMDILNTTTADRNYISSCEVKVIYDEDFEYQGWCYQYDWNKSNGDSKKSANQPINSADVFPIEPMYMGHYCFGCTLPNAVVEGTAPLSLVINIDGNELTYNVRK